MAPRPGPGYRVVTGTFRHHQALVLDVAIEGQPSAIGSTPNHPFWSEDRQNFVRADALRPGERLRQADGSTYLAASTTFTYDGIGRLTDLQHAKYSTNIADYDWKYDAFGRVTDMAFDFQVGGTGSSSYSYDNNGQLTAADHDYQTDETYSYDETGNRTNTGYTTGDNNQLTSDGAFNYAYDEEGNRTTRYMT